VFLYSPCSVFVHVLLGAFLELLTATWKAIVLVLFRSASLPERAEVHHMHGYMYSQGWQHERAGYYQQEFLMHGSGPCSSAQHVP